MTLPPPAHVVEIERRLRWPALPALLFLGILGMLFTLASVSMWLRPEHPRGLPEDAALLERAGLPDPSLGVLAADIRFSAAALGGEAENRAVDAATIARVREAERALARWTRRHPGEPRVRAALGALALVRHDYATAANRYREACERAPHYGEGRLGWGVALALEAERTTDAWQRRGLDLRAIAQFAEVDRSQPEYRAALYNRALLLVEVGRRDQARVMARRYLELEPAGPWAERIRSRVLAG